MPSTGKILLFVLLLVGSSYAADPQTQDHSVIFKQLYSFSNRADGAYLYGGVSRDPSGNLYGVAYTDNDTSGDGTLYKLTPSWNRYTFQVVHYFSQLTGRNCATTPTIDRWGNVFGVCRAGGSAGDWGTLWEYSALGQFSVLNIFGGPGEGMGPEDSVSVDKAGNIYGTAYTWGTGGAGTLWEYSPRSGTFTVLHAFSNGDDGGLLQTGPAIDYNGVIWGTTSTGPNCYYCGDGTLWNYDPASKTFTVVLDFSNTAIRSPLTKLIADEGGNLYGTAYSVSGGQNDCGLVFELPKDSDYIPVVLYQFTGQNGDGCYPYGRLRFDRTGNLLGTTLSGGGDDGFGTVYELEPESGNWQEIILHSFDLSDGAEPEAGLATDRHGNWFGTTSSGGADKVGNVFEISGVP